MTAMLPGQRVKTDDSVLVEYRNREGVIRGARGQEVHVDLESDRAHPRVTIWCFATQVRPVPVLGDLRPSDASNARPVRVGDRVRGRRSGAYAVTGINVTHDCFIEVEDVGAYTRDYIEAGNVRHEDGASIDLAATIEAASRASELKAVGEGRTCVHDWYTIESDDQAGAELVKCRACGVEQMHKLRDEQCPNEAPPAAGLDWGDRDALAKASVESWKRKWSSEAERAAWRDGYETRHALGETGLSLEDLELECEIEASGRYDQRSDKAPPYPGWPGEPPDPGLEDAHRENAAIRRAYLNERQRATAACNELRTYDPSMADKIESQAYRDLVGHGLDYAIPVACTHSESIFAGEDRLGTMYQWCPSCGALNGEDAKWRSPENPTNAATATEPKR